MQKDYKPIQTWQGIPKVFNPNMAERLYLYPRRIWLEGFSRKPSMLKAVIWIMIIANILIILGNLSSRAWYKHEQALCLSFHYPSEWNKEYCGHYGVTFQPLNK